MITWIVALVVIGSIIGSLTIAEISMRYSTLNRSHLTPPNYVFPVMWNILYSAIGSCGWVIWRSTPFPVPEYYQNFVYDSAYFKLDLDPFVFLLAPDQNFSSYFDFHGYYSWYANFASLSKNKNCISAYDAILTMDSNSYI